MPPRLFIVSGPASSNTNRRLEGSAAALHEAARRQLSLEVGVEIRVALPRRRVDVNLEVAAGMGVEGMLEAEVVGLLRQLPPSSEFAAMRGARRASTWRPRRSRVRRGVRRTARRLRLLGRHRHTRRRKRSLRMRRPR